MNNDPRRNERMAMSMEDKLWFLRPCSIMGIPNDPFLESKTTLQEIYAPDVGNFFDYGCGDGTLLSLMKERMPSSVNFLGYDLDPEQSKLANLKGISTVESTKVMQWKMKLNFRPNALILSSVLHEMYTDNLINPELFEKFIGSPDYIFVRDMFWGMDDCEFPEHISRKIVNLFNDCVSSDKCWNTFGHRYNHSLKNGRRFLDFLLHYQYRDNIRNEIDEKYLRHDHSSFRNIFEKNGYEKVYMKTYLLPYFRDWLKESTGIDLEGVALSHVNAIYRRKTPCLSHSTTV